MAVDMKAALAKLQAIRDAEAAKEMQQNAYALASATGEARREAGPEAAAEGSTIQSQAPAPTTSASASAPAPTPMLGALAALTKLSAATTHSVAGAVGVAPAPASQPALPLAPPAVLPVNPEMQQQHPELVTAVQDLANALHTQEPGIEMWLERIHEQLRAYPELCHILTPEQVRTLCDAWMAKTQSYVVATVTKSKSGAKAAKVAGVKLSDADL